MSFVDKVLNLISKNRITKNKMLVDLKLSKNSFVNWQERGTIPSGETLTKIADYFNVSTDYLLGNEQKNKPLVNNDEELTEYLEQLKTRPEMKMLFHLASGATKEDVEKAVKIVEAFLKKD